MKIVHLFPRPEDDDADYSERLPFDLGRFLDAIERTPALPGGFGLHDVHKVEQSWEFLDIDSPAHGYLVDLVDGRRVLLEAQQGPDIFEDALTIEPVAPGTVPNRRREDEECAPWYEAHHITLHVAELKLLPPLLD